MLKTWKEKFIGDRAFYKMVLLIAVPIMIQNGITNFVNLLDNIMVGQIGTEQMSGVAIVNQLMFVFNICVFGAVSGAGIFGTQYYGKGDYEGQKYAYRFKVYSSAFITILAALLFIFGGEFLISLYLSDSGSVGDITLALKYGQEYLAIMVIGLFPFALAQTYISSVRECGETFVPMLAGLVAVFTNLVLDVILIFGLLGFPVLGVKGAAIATVVARFVECIIVVAWTHMHKMKNKFIVGAYRSFRIPKNICFAILKKGTPLMLNEMFWASGMAVITQCYAVRGLEVVAAQNISSTITNLFNVVYIQLGSCIAIVVGQLLGAGKIEEAKEYVSNFMDEKIDRIVSLVNTGDDVLDAMLSAKLAICKEKGIKTFCDIAKSVEGVPTDDVCSMLSIMIVLGRFFPSIYKTEESIKELATTFIAISAAVMPICAFCHCTYFTLRSGGKTGVTFIFDSVYTWVLVIPFAFVLANYTTLTIQVVFFLVSFMEIVKATIGFFMVRSGVWLQNIVNE